MPGLTREEKKRRAERPPEIEEGSRRRNLKKRRVFEESFQALVVFKNEHLHCNVPLRYAKDRRLGQWVVNTRNSRGDCLTEEQKKKLTEAGFDWETKEEKNERRWNEMFARLQAYRQEHLNCCVPQYYKRDPQLARWVNIQRQNEADNKILPHRKEKLDSIDFTWRRRKSNRDSSAEDKKWLQKYRRLVDFHREHGHCFVPTKDDQSPEERELGCWVSHQRRHLRDRKLSKERKCLLNELNFVWEIDKADPNASLTQAEWDRMFKHLMEFKEKYGHVEVNRKFSKWGLGLWVSFQRAEGRKGRLDPRRAKRLQEIGVAWGKDWDQRWEEGFAMLRNFKKKHGHCRVPTNRPKGKKARRKFNIKLAIWVQNQRAFKETGVLLPARKGLLDKVGFLWSGEQANAHISPGNHHYSSEDNAEEDSHSVAQSESKSASGPEDVKEDGGISQRDNMARKCSMVHNPSKLSAPELSTNESDSDSEFEFEGADVVGVWKNTNGTNPRLLHGSQSNELL